LNPACLDIIWAGKHEPLTLNLNSTSQIIILFLDTSVPSAYYNESAKERKDEPTKSWKDALSQYLEWFRENETASPKQLREGFYGLREEKSEAYMQNILTVDSIIH
jgi:hypothetical protein